MTHSPRQPGAIDFAAIKAAASIAAVLASYGIELRGGGTERMARCPFHEDSTPSLQVNVEKNLFNCFGCGAKGSVLDFVAKKDGLRLREAATRIAAMTAGRRDEKAPAGEPAEAGSSRRWRETPSTERGPERISRNPPCRFHLSLSSDHSCFAERGLSQETVRHFGLGYCTSGLMRGRIAIPIHDEARALVAFAGRSLGADEDLPGGRGKYRFPHGFKKSLVLYNLHRLPTGANEVVLVEGFFGVFALHQAGYENVVALMGSTLSRGQQELLSRFQRVILLLDGDVAGRAATDTIFRSLKGRIDTRAAWCRLGQQPDTISADELRELLS